MHRLLFADDPYFDPSAVLLELDRLEGHSRGISTKNEAPFRKNGPLARVWHKHFFSARHLLKNLNIRWNASGGGNGALDQIINEVASEHGEDPERWQARLAHRLVVEAFEDRAGAQRLTGDWIIYGKHEGSNYYLDLATHEEAQAYGDEKLLDKLRAGSAAEFPFLFDKK